MQRNLTVTLLRLLLAAFLTIPFSTVAQAPLYTGVLISDVGTGNGIGQANTSRNLGVDAAGNIYAVFSGSLGIRVAKSINRGQSFGPSVQIATTNAEPEIEVAANGNVYVAWNVGLDIYFSVSTDGGATFSAAVKIATAPPGNPSSISGYVPHVASFGSNVYILPQSNKTLYRNSTNGAGAFTATSVGTSIPTWFFSDVRTDRNGEVYVVVDDPKLYLFRSLDNGASFVQVSITPLIPAPSVNFSSYAMIAGSFGSYLFTGGFGTNGVRINVNTGASNSLTLMGVSGNNYGRSLFADEFGNVVDGYTTGTTPTNGIIGFKVSHNQGQTWNPEVNMFAAQTHNIFRNPVYQDVLVAYKQNDQVYLAVYNNLLLGLTNTTPPLSDCAGKPITITYTALGPFLAGNVFTAQLSDASGSFANPVNIGSVTSTTSGTIAAVIPPNTPGGTGYRIRVKSSTPELFGTDNGSNLTVNPNPGSNFTFATQQCEGTAVVFTNTTPANPGAAIVQWTFGTLGASAQTSPSFLFPPGGPYDVKLVSTTAQGCKDSLTQQVTVGAKPVPQFTTNAATQCIAANNFVFTNATPNPASFTYEWKFGDGAVTGGLNASHTYSAVGTFTVTLIATAANGCRDSIKHDVTVNTSTNPSFSVNAAAQCLGINNFIFTNTTPPGSTYEWKFGDGATATIANPSHVYAASNVYTVKLVATAGGGCKDSTEQQVTVNPNPTAAFTINTPVAQCFKDHNYSFTNGSTTGATLLYHFGDGGTSALPNPSHTYAAAGDYIVKLVATNSFGCKDSIPQTVTVKPSPAPGFTVNAATQCLVNNAFQFTNTSTAPSGAMTYDWRFGDGGTSTLRDPVHSYAATGTYTVKLYVRVGGDCLDSAQATVNINPTPDAGFTANSVNAQCLNGNSYSFTNISTIASGTLSYLWKFGDGVTATTLNATHVYTTAGTYLVKLYATAPTGCIDSADYTLTVHPKPAVSFINDNPEQCLATNHFTFTNTTTIGSGTMTQRWFYGDGATSTGVTGDHTYAIFGQYIVKLVVTSDKGCKDSSSQNIDFLPKPVPVFTINDDGQCLTGNAFTFTDASTITAGTFTREWRYGDGGTATTVNGSRTYATPNTYEVALILVSDRGCRDTLRKPVYVYPMPATDFTVNTGAQCVNIDLFTFTNSSTIGSGTMTYSWTFGDGGTATTASPTYSYTVPNNYTVRLVATSDQGCLGEKTAPVEVWAQPGRANFTVNAIEQCLTANNFLFTNTSPTAGGPLTYRWFYGDGTESTTTDGTKRYAAIGDYEVRLVSISPNGCVSDTMPQVVKVHPEPTVDLGADRIVLEGLGIKLNPVVTGTGLTYVWTPDRYLSSGTQKSYSHACRQCNLYVDRKEPGWLHR